MQFKIIIWKTVFTDIWPGWINSDLLLHASFTKFTGLANGRAKKFTNVIFYKLVLTPPSKCKLFGKKIVSQNFFWCSQNLTNHILVFKKYILKPLFTVYPLFHSVSFGVDPPPFWKNFTFWIILDPFPSFFLNIFFVNFVIFVREVIKKKPCRCKKKKKNITKS